MKIIKNSCSIILWIGIVVIGNLVMSIRASEIGDNMKEAYGYVQKSFSESTPFWLILGFLLIVVITLNLHHSKSKTIIIMALSTLTIIMAIWFFMNFSNSLNDYNYMLTHMKVPEIGKAVLKYRTQGFLLTIIAIILSGYNIARVVINSKKS